MSPPVGFMARIVPTPVAGNPFSGRASASPVAGTLTSLPYLLTGASLFLILSVTPSTFSLCRRASLRSSLQRRPASLPPLLLPGAAAGALRSSSLAQPTSLSLRSSALRSSFLAWPASLSLHSSSLARRPSSCSLRSSSLARRPAPFARPPCPRRRRPSLLLPAPPLSRARSTVVRAAGTGTEKRPRTGIRLLCAASRQTATASSRSIPPFPPAPPLHPTPLAFRIPSAQLTNSGLLSSARYAWWQWSCGGLESNAKLGQQRSVLDSWSMLNGAAVSSSWAGRSETQADIQFADPEQGFAPGPSCWSRLLCVMASKVSRNWMMFGTFL